MGAEDNHVMGAEDNRQEQEIPSLDLKTLKVISVLGRGAKGVVFLVKNEATGENLALKVMLKALIEKKIKENGDKDGGSGSAYRRTWFERDVLQSFRHQLLPRLRGVLETEKVIGLAIDYCPGGDLNTFRKNQTEKMVSDDIIRFYGAQLVLALEYLHELGIVYRDLKPENVMIQENGHVMLVDFDLSTKLSAKSPKPRQILQLNTKSSETIQKSKSVKYKRSLSLFHCFGSEISPVDSDSSGTESRVKMTQRPDSASFYGNEKSNSFVGTEEYVSPEIIRGNGHDFAVDSWCLGVLLYEMLYGRTPFKGVNRKETFFRILVKSPELVGEPTALRDLIGKLLEKDPAKRISIEEVKRHYFFRGVDWESILEISRPPFIPLRPERDMQGIKHNDLELFVQGVFADEVVEKREEDNQEVLKETLKNPSEKADFSVF